jgi:3-methyladenine DNA glycosylase AlkD
MREEVETIRVALRQHMLPTPSRTRSFFKTGKGDYAEKDEFIGVPVPSLRKIAKNFSNISVANLNSLLSSTINEERLLALLILTTQYQQSTGSLQQTYYQFYLDNLAYVNNWNLVDASAHLILGAHLWDKDRSLLLTLAQSTNLWERRIAMVSTWYFIRKHDFLWTFKIAQLLLNDPHDLIHKAVGWMLREAGKRNLTALMDFLNDYAPKMPRTTLRYAIEKLPTDQRNVYLKNRPVNKPLLPTTTHRHLHKADRNS